MTAVIGELLPFALGIMISPIPIIAAILMLLSPKARRTSLGFLAGWAVGIAVATVVFTLLSALIPEDGASDSKPIAGTITIILGALLLFLSIHEWRSRPRPGAEPAFPKWMAAIDTMTAPRGLALGFALAALNPKNLIMAASAGSVIAAGKMNTGQTITVVILFVIVAAASVGIPVIAYFVASDRLSAALEGMRKWLLTNNAVIMAVLLLVTGVSQIGKGIGKF
ncbi:GAP family protein [Leucobacter viscericola]|uniref:GAP family protein n=1 Tax=Leucobacter viscericola TaxID=2714935 RepID=A0A6G7XCF2_9MICO|nr:GAP family protein [Leucobacter viscericola]QIK62051.1 GAP family protein [Leucobacter viscericola]